MFKQFKAAKVLALLTVAMGALYAPKVADDAGGSAIYTGIGLAGIYGATGYYAYNSVATTPGSVVTAPTVMAVQTRKILGLVSAVSSEAVAAMNGGGGNVADSSGGVKLAGSSGSQHRASAWLRASHGAIDNSETGQNWNGHSYLMMLGADYRFNNMFCAGLGLSYSRLDARTEFNNGTMIHDTVGINPYLVVAPHNNFYLELVTGANWTSGKDTRRWIVDRADARFAAPQHIDNKFSASPKSNTVFGGVFANFINTMGKTNYGLQVGYLMAQTKFKSFSETSESAEHANRAMSLPSYTFKVGTVTGKVKAGYQLTPCVMPYVTLHAEYDAQRNEGLTYSKTAEYKISRSAFGGGAGLNFKGDDALSGGLEFDYSQRSKLKTYVTGLRLHYGF